MTDKWHLVDSWVCCLCWCWIHPSSNTAYPAQGRGGGWTLSRQEVRSNLDMTPGYHGADIETSNLRHTHICTPEDKVRANVTNPPKLHVYGLWWKVEYPHADTGGVVSRVAIHNTKQQSLYGSSYGFSLQRCVAVDRSWWFHHPLSGSETIIKRYVRFIPQWHS